MSELIVAGNNGAFIAEDIQAYLADERYPLFCSQSLLDNVLGVFPQFNRSRWSSIVPIGECFAKIRSHADSPGVILLTSGDPLFYGIGKRLRKEFFDWEVKFFPAVSYMQSCFSHFGIHWEDAEFLSLHGRPLESINEKLLCPKLFVYTDPENTPDRIAQHLKTWLAEAQLETRELLIGECLGSKNQRFTVGSIEEVSTRSFRQPNCMIIIDKGGKELGNAPRFGLAESEISHSRGLITKSEVRAAVIHRLCLPETGIFWDVGAGSGSISLEVSRLYRALNIFAVEKEEEQLANIRANMSRYRSDNVRIMAGEAPEILHQLPPPDSVFVGGSGGRLEEILSFLSTAVKDTTRIVITAVLEETARRAPEILHRYDFNVDISLIQVTRFSYPEKSGTPFNPIHIISARKNR